MGVADWMLDRVIMDKLLCLQDEVEFFCFVKYRDTREGGPNGILDKGIIKGVLRTN